jgi:sulfide dehydrogenase cytochrome subunit
MKNPLMKHLLLATVIALVAAVFSPSHAAEPTGVAMAHTCAGCHGTQGKLGTVEFVPLAGLPESEFLRAMRDFRAGKRPATLMGLVAHGFSDSELQAMARHFANIK